MNMLKISDESKLSVVTKHMLENNHTFDWQNIKIIDFKTNYYKKLISEMIYIKIQKNGLNSVSECLALNVWSLHILIYFLNFLTKNNT